MTTRPRSLRIMAFVVAAWLLALTVICAVYLPYEALQGYGVLIITVVNGLMSGIFVAYGLGRQMSRPFHQFDP